MWKHDFPLRKTFEQDFIRPDGKQLFTLRYQQATIEEYNEFFALDIDARAKYLVDLIRGQIRLSFWEKVQRFFSKNFVSKIERELDMPLIIRNVLANKFRAYKSIYDALPENKNRAKGSGGGLESANLAIVCQRYNTDLFTLRKNATVEQYLWLLDGIIYLNNEMDDEGKAKNTYVTVDRDAAAKRAKETREAFNKIKNKPKK